MHERHLDCCQLGRQSNMTVTRAQPPLVSGTTAAAGASALVTNTHGSATQPASHLPTCASTQSNSLSTYSGADSRTGFLYLTPSAHKYSYCTAHSSRPDSRHDRCIGTWATSPLALPATGLVCNRLQGCISGGLRIPCELLLHADTPLCCVRRLPGQAFLLPAGCWRHTALHPADSAHPGTGSLPTLLPADMTSQLLSVQNSASVLYRTEMAL